jgi:hypothetical protein
MNREGAKGAKNLFFVEFKTDNSTKTIPRVNRFMSRTILISISLSIIMPEGQGV